MKTRLLETILVLFMSCSASFAQVSSNDVTVDEANKHPDLVSDLSKTSVVRIFLAKKTYHLEELLALDVGLLVNDFDKSYYPNQLAFRIRVTDQNNNRIAIKNLLSVENPSIFERQKNALIKGSSLILVGCENETIGDLSRRMNDVKNNENNLRVLLDSDLYRTSPENCIDVNGPATLSIQVEVYNDWVVTNDKADSRTAVGKVTSNVLRVTIRK